MSATIRVPERVRSGELLPVVSVSGGKDSTAAVLALREAEVEARYVFADTGWEAPETIAHIEALRRVLGVEIATVRAPRQMVARMLYGASAPTRLGRWCTKELKIEPLRRHHDLIELAEHRETVSVIGNRRSESLKRAEQEEFEDFEPWGGWVWRPILDWAVEDVLLIHRRHGVPLNPLYHRGHERVGCYPCVFAPKEEVRLIAKNAPQRIAQIAALEAEMTRLRAERNAERPGRYRLPIASFFQGRAGLPVPVIGHVVAWAEGRETRQGQVTIDPVEPPPPGGCFKWGLCEPLPTLDAPASPLPRQDPEGQGSPSRAPTAGGPPGEQLVLCLPGTRTPEPEAGEGKADRRRRRG